MIPVIMGAEYSTQPRTRVLCWSPGHHGSDGSTRVLYRKMKRVPLTVRGLGCLQYFVSSRVWWSHPIGSTMLRIRYSIRSRWSTLINVIWLGYHLLKTKQSPLLHVMINTLHSNWEHCMSWYTPPGLVILHVITHSIQIDRIACHNTLHPHCNWSEQIPIRKRRYTLKRYYNCIQSKKEAFYKQKVMGRIWKQI